MSFILDHNGSALLDQSSNEILDHLNDGQASVSISGTGVVAVAESSGRQDSGSATGAATVTCSGTAVEFHTGTAAISGTGSITVTIQMGAERSTSISGTGTVSASSQKEAQSPPVTISGTSSFSIEYSLIEARDGAASISGTGTVTASFGPVGHSGSATSSATGTVTATASPEHRGSGTCTGTGTVTVIGSMGAFRSATVTAVGSLSYTADVFAPTHYWYPDVIESVAGLTGTVANIDEPVATPDDSWLVNS